jgi:23S rRNA pseudouridine2605 synthase/16S rRNA pseudouridine516 synthase
LAEAGVASRRRCKELVSAGKVRVNGQVAASPGDWIDPERDQIEVDGKRVWLDTEKIYILLNKPPGYLSTTADHRGRQTIMDLLPPVDNRIYPVGRLDRDTEGLLLITNDGDLTYRLTHPKHHVEKVYLVWVTGSPSEESLDKLRHGIALEDGMTAPALVRREACKDRPQTRPDCLRITIHEGRKRQVRRMCAAIGHNVLKLKRIQIGPIHLGDLRPGDHRHLSKEEVAALKRETMLDT